MYGMDCDYGHALYDQIQRFSLPAGNIDQMKEKKMVKTKLNGHYTSLKYPDYIFDKPFFP